MPSSIGDDWDLSFCGLNCVKCDIFLSSHGDEKLQEELVKWFKENVDSTIEHVNCEKCRSPIGECWSSDCELRSCATKRNVNYCFECPDFVCDKLDKFANDGYGHHKRTVENMRDMKKKGLKKWISFHKEAQFCP